MEEKETLWEKMFKKTPKEEEIQKRIDEEMENYKNSPEHVAHHKRMDALFDELHDAQSERLADAKEYREQRFPRKAVDFRKETEEQRENRLAELRKKKEERIASLPENLRNAIALYNSLSDNESFWKRSHWV